MKFTRIVTFKGDTTYYFDNKVVSFEEYNIHLKRIGILIKARNFLVFQGDVESIASMSSIERTKHFEEISGSIEYEEEYGEILKLKEEAEKVELQNVSEKRAIQKEKNQYKEQQKITESYHQKKKQLVDLKRDYFLWQLFLVKKDLETALGDRNKIEKEMVSICNKEQNMNDHIETHKKDLNKFMKKKKEMEKATRKSKAKVKEKEHQLMNLKEKFNHVSKKLNSTKNEASEIKKATALKKRDISSLQKSTEEVDKAIKILQMQEEDRISRSIKKSNQLTEEQLDELKNIRQQIEVKTVTERESIQTLHSNEKVKLDEKNRLESKLDGLKNQIADISSALREVDKEVGNISDDINELEKKNMNNRKKKELCKSELKANLEKKEKLTKEASKLSKVLDKLSIVNLERKRERKNGNEAEALKSKIQGVYGRLVDLLEPKEKKYEEALTTALGRKNLEAIVCDTLETAKECVKYLKEHEIRAKTFLPLDSIKINRAHETNRQKLRHFSTSNNQSFKIALDVVRYDDKIKKALDYALGSTVICQNLNDAQYMIFRKKQKCKVVTLHGEVISADGSSMTGGLMAQGKTNRFEQREADKVFKNLERIDDELIALRKAINSQEDILYRSRDDSSERYKASLVLKRNALKLKTEQKKKLETENSALISALEDMKVEMKQIEVDLKNCKSDISKFEQLISEKESELLKEFENKHNITNVKQYEQETLKKKEAFLEKLTELTNQKTRIEGRIKYHRTLDLDSRLKSLTKKIEFQNDEKLSLEKQLREEEISEVSLEKAYTEHVKKEKEVKRKVSDIQSLITETIKKREDLIKEKNKIIKKKSKIDVELEKVRATRHEILNNAVISEVSIPTVKSKLISDTEVKQVAMETIESSQSGTSSENLDSQSYSQSNPVTNAFSQDESATVRQENLQMGMISFESLLIKAKKKKFLDRFNGKNISKIKHNEREFIRNIFETDLDALEKQLNTLEPNLGAKEDLTEVNQKLKSNIKSLKESSGARRRLEERFEEIKTLRYDRFMSMFKHVGSVIDKIYKDLTRSNVHTLGGSAYINLEDPDEPWNGGVRVIFFPIIFFSLQPLHLVRGTVR